MDEKSRENAKWNFTIFVLIRHNFSLVLQLIFCIHIREKCTRQTNWQILEFIFYYCCGAGRTLSDLPRSFKKRLIFSGIYYSNPNFWVYFIKCWEIFGCKGSQDKVIASRFKQIEINGRLTWKKSIWKFLLFLRKILVIL